MIIYQASKQQFLKDIIEGVLTPKLVSSYVQKLGKRPSPSEEMSFNNSLPRLQSVLIDEEIPSDLTVCLEYTIPSTGRRIDMLLTGKGPNSKPCAVIIELKQWQKVDKTDQDAIVITRMGGHEQEEEHPSYQAWTYAALMRFFIENLHNGEVDLHPCVYMHNYSNDDPEILNPFYSHHYERAPIFRVQDALKLRDFIKERIKYGDNGETLRLIEEGKIRPSRELGERLLDMMKHNDEFVLVGNQKLVYEKIKKAVSSRKKEVIIVDGGPGTGKTVVAVSAMIHLLKSQKNTRYVSKNAAPRAVYAAKLTGAFTKSYVNNLFVGSGKFVDAERDSFDVLLADEAHRLVENGMYQTGGNQVREIILAARCSVFFIDEAQKVSMKDIGSKAEIEKWARAAGANITHMTLDSQFRCNGADGYLAWLDNTLQIRETANTTLEGIDYDFRVVDSPTELRSLIEEKNALNNKARMVAGYCWDWNSQSDRAAYDIVIPEYGFEARWNLTDDGSLWLIKPNSVKEVGCIHTCQGLELDYVGVIIGKDLIYRDGQVLVDPTKRSGMDKTLNGYRQVLRDDPERAKAEIKGIIKNTYRTLMTRGMKGCYVWCENKEFMNYILSSM